jgi:hypothetical protein
LQGRGRLFLRCPESATGRGERFLQD